MLPRERVLAALAGEKPDRTPRDFWAEKPTLERLYRHLGHGDEERLLRDLGIDLRHLNAAEPSEREVRPGVFENFWGERYIYREGPWGAQREDMKGALAEAKSFSDIEAFPFPTPDCMDHSKLESLSRLHGEHALIYGFADVWERPALVRGWEEWFVDLVLRPDWVRYLSRKFTDFYLEDYTRAAEATGGRIDIYLLITDLGSQAGPLISLKMFQDLAAPYLKEMIDRIHSFGARVMYHSCGSIIPFIPDLIDLGVDILDPIQPTGPEMAPERLQAAFGGRISFHGGIDMQRVLPQSTPEEVRAEARRYCEAFGGRRYILAPAHFFQPDIPPENILAVYEAGS